MRFGGVSDISFAFFLLKKGVFFFSEVSLCLLFSAGFRCDEMCERGRDKSKASLNCHVS